MKVEIAGKNLKIPPRLEEYINKKFPKLERVLEDLVSCSVVVSEIRNSHSATYEVEATARTGHGRIVRAETTAPDVFVAVDRVADKLEAQVRRLKGRLIARSHSRKGSRRETKQQLPVGQAEQYLSELPDGVTISRMKRFELEPMSPEQAAEEMELLGHSFYLFINERSGQPAVIYRRKEGDFGLIEPLEER